MTPATAIHHKDDQDYLHRMQKRLEEKISENIIYHGLNDVSKSRNSSASEDNEAGEVDPATSASAMDYDLLMGNKDTCVLEVNNFAWKRHAIFLKMVKYLVFFHISVKNYILHWNFEKVGFCNKWILI